MMASITREFPKMSTRKNIVIDVANAACTGRVNIGTPVPFTDSFIADDGSI